MDFQKIPVKSLLKYERATSKNAFVFLRTIKDDTSMADLTWLAFFAKTAIDPTYTFEKIEELTFADIMSIVSESNAPVVDAK